MKERPILFSGAMVRAILDGTKTQTRRVMKPQPEPCGDEYPRPGHWWPSRAHQSMLHVEDELQNIKGGWQGLAASACPYGGTCDGLWVRETWAYYGGGEYLYQRNPGSVAYRADSGVIEGLDPIPGGRWRPSIHMPRWASRLLLSISDVRVQRLQDITSADILAEGVRIPACEESGNPLIDVSTPNGPAAFLTREQFSDCDALLRAHWAALWCSINGRASWDANPWVWALSFNRVRNT